AENTSSYTGVALKEILESLNEVRMNRQNSSPPQRPPNPPQRASTPPQRSSAEAGSALTPQSEAPAARKKSSAKKAERK
ncbi:MAG TPA: hypothetical protein VN764_06525, partial [Polyangiaceae bacterium]|nr:hypothetical protein [Polyangiaceae bacterium]